jgi:hypothetical protein
LFLDTVTDSQHLHGDDLPRLALAKQGDTFEDGRAGGGCYILGSFLMNIQAETGLVDQVDHVKTVTKANMIMFTFLLPAQQHVSVLVTL